MSNNTNKIVNPLKVITGPNTRWSYANVWAITAPKDADKDTVLAIAMKEERVSASLEGKTIVKEIVVPNKIVNFVVR